MSRSNWRNLTPPRLSSRCERSDTRLAAWASIESGTLVLWEAMDRMVAGGPPDDSRAQRRFLELARSIEAHLAMVFHRFLGQPGRLAIWVNDVRVQPWDPFLM